MAGLTISLSHEDNTSITGTSASSIDIGIATEVSITYSSSITPSEVIIWGWKGAFCMDMGVGMTMRIDYTRVSPDNPNDNSSDSTKWSNAHWRDVMKDELGIWQTRHYGYRLIMTPDNADQFPTISNVGYISTFTSPLSADKVQAISGTVSFDVGRITQNGS